MCNVPSANENPASRINVGYRSTNSTGCGYTFEEPILLVKDRCAGLMISGTRSEVSMRFIIDHMSNSPRF